MSKKIKSHEKNVGLLYDSISLNTGDIAIGIALSQQLEKRGIIPEIIDPYAINTNAYTAIIIGGGQLLRDPGDEFYDKFRIKGKHILNSVGVSGSKDFKYLNNYLFVSTRSSYESQILEDGSDVKVSTIPCTTTLLESDRYTIPGLKREPNERIVGIHLVPDVLTMCPNIIQIINDIPHKKVFIPFTHYNQDASFMRNLPIDKSNAIMLDKLTPLELHSVMSQMDYVIVSSLHASIFAYSQNIPFISMYQKKAYDYFKDRNLEKYIYKNQEQLTDLIKYVESTHIDMNKQILKDKKIVNETIDKFVEIIDKLPQVANKIKKITTPNLVHRMELQIKQLEAVVEGRDIVIHNMIYENMRSNEKKLNTLHSKVIDLENELHNAKRGWIPPILKTIIRKIQG